MATDLPPPTHPRRLYTLLTLGAFVAFLLLLTICLGQREFWTDEEVTSGHIVWWASTADAFHPRGYYALLYGWKHLFGDGDLALRAFSVPWSLLVLLLVWAIGSRLLRPGQTLLALWLVSLSPFIVLYFRMARFYSMVTALTMLAAYCALLVAQEGRIRHWLALSVCAVALIETNYVASTLLGPLFLWLAVAAWRRGQLWRLALACVAPAALVVAGAARVAGYAAQISDIEASAGNLSPMHVLLRLALPAFSLAVGETTDPWRIHITLPVLAAAGVGFILGLRARLPARGAALLRWAWPLSVAVVALVLSTTARGEPLSAAARSTIMTAPFAYMLLAIGITQVTARTWRAVMLAVLLVGDVYGLGNYFAGRQFLNPGYAVPWRQVAQVILEREKLDDVVVAYYDTTISRYAPFNDFIRGRPDYHPEELERVEHWPEGGFRLWLVTRDRGSAEARRLQQHTVRTLTPRAARVEVFKFMPLSPLDQRFRSMFLRRKVEDAYVKVYLFVPPKYELEHDLSIASSGGRRAVAVVGAVH